MADEAAPETDAPPPPDTTPDAEPDTPTDDRLPDDHPVVKALKKANEEAAAARLKVKEFEDANKSDLERAQSDRDAERERADAAETELARLKAALKFKLDEDDLELLGTGTPEEIEQRAEKLAARIGGDKNERDRSPDRRLGRTDPNESSKDAQARALFGV